MLSDKYKNIIEELRKKAEEMLENPSSVSNINYNESDFKKLLHELEVHQIELEIQNKNLQETTNSLEISQAKYYDLFDSAPVGYMTINDISKIIEINTKAADMLADDKLRLIGKHLSSFVHPDYQDEFYFHMQKIFRVEDQFSTEIKIVNTVGRTVYVLLESKPIFKENITSLVHCALYDITDRKLAEEKVNYQTEILSVISNMINYAVFTIDDEFRISRWNEQIAKFTGFTESDVIGRSVNFLFDLEYHNILKYLRHKTEIKSKDSVKAKLINSNRSVKHVLVDLSISNEFGYVVVLKDISEKVADEEQIYESENRFKAIIEKTPVGLCITDERGYFEYVNNAYCKIYKYQPEELIGNHFTNVVRNEYKEILNDLHDKFIEGTAEPRGEWKVIDKYKNDLFILADAARILGKDGKYRKVTFVINISKSKKLEQFTSGFNKILEKLALGVELDNIFNLIVDLFESIEFKIAMSINLINQETLEIEHSYCKRAGIDYKNTVIGLRISKESGSSGKSFIDKELTVIDEPIKHANFKNYREILQKNKVISVWTYPILNNSKQSFGTVNFYFTEKNEDEDYYSNIIHTISRVSSIAMEMQQAKMQILAEKDKAELANKTKTLFLANMSHEIRTPLNSVLGFAELLKFETYNEVKAKDYIESILLSGNNLLNLINDILDLSKIEAGKLEINRNTINLKSLFREIEHIFSVKIMRKSLSYKTNIAENVPINIISDEVRIRQILFNLIGNAVKFTNEGTVSINVEARNFNDKSTKTDILIEVIDTGIGIESSKIYSIFDSFTRAHSSSRIKTEGTGLGLAISKRLAEMLNGDISVVSREGVGSKFTLTLTNVQIDTNLNDSEESKSLTALQNINFNNARVLIIDDNFANREIYKGFLNPHGLELYFLQNCKDLIKSELNFDPDVIIIDFKYPADDRVSRLQEIDNNSKCKGKPIIGVTSSDDAHDEMIIKEKTNVLLKIPISKFKLLDTISKYIAFTDSDAGKSNKKYKYNDPENYNLSLYTPEIKKELSETIFKEWTSAKKSMILDQIKSFANGLFDYAEKNNLEPFKLYANELKSYLEVFNIERILKIIPYYEEMINLINNEK